MDHRTLHISLFITKFTIKFGSFHKIILNKCQLLQYHKTVNFNFKRSFQLGTNENLELFEQLIEIANADAAEVSRKYRVPKYVIRQARDGSPGVIINDTYPYPEKMAPREYQILKADLQVELAKLQSWAKSTGQKIIILFEGRDAAGKGGTIKRFTEHLNPRGARVVALEKPSDIERGQWYFQRYVNHFPTEGEIVFFDRSWYNRAGVEKVMGFCTEKEYRDFMMQVPAFERMLINSGIVLIKFWFSVGRVEQLRRFIARTYDPLKQWKLSPMDVASLGLWNEYSRAKETMFSKTHTKESPWVVIKSDDKKRARLNAMRYLIDQFKYENKSTNNLLKTDSKILNYAHKAMDLKKNHKQQENKNPPK